MTLFSRLFSGRQGAPDDAKANISVDKFLRQLDMVRATAAGESVTPANCLRSPTMFAIVNALSRVLGMLPIDVIQGAGATRKELPGHELAGLLNRRPNQWQSQFDYWFAVGAQLILYGEFVAVKNQAFNGKLVNLVPVPPGACTIAQDPSDFTFRYLVNRTDGSSQVYGPKQIHHIRMGTVDGVNPIRPVDNIRESIAMEIAAEKFGAQLFGSGAIPNIVLEHPGHFQTDESRKSFGRSWNNAFRKKRGTAVLEDGMKITPLQLTNEESQFLQTRKHQRTVIAGAFGIPPHRIGDLERATFSNIEHQALEFVTYALMPYLVAIESAIWRDLIPDPQKANTSVKFNVDALLRGDSKSRAESLAIERQNGVISANEWRALTDRAPRTDPGGDEYITPLNMGSGKPPPGDNPDDKPDGPAPPDDPDEPKKETTE